jgi:preprotein translocase subunit SecD
VNTQGSDEIVVQVPGASKNNLINLVTQVAQLRFRLVAQVSPTTGPTTPPSTGASPSGSPSPSPGSGVLLPSNSPKPKATSTAKPDKNTGKNRAPFVLGKHHQKAQKTTSTKAPKPTTSPTPTPSDAPTSTTQVNYTAANRASFQDGLTWMTNPDPQSVAVYNAYTCPTTKPVHDDPTLPLVTCQGSQKYLLSPAQIEGTQIDSASAAAPGSSQGQVQWTVNIQLDSKGADTQRKLSAAMAGDQSKLFAIVLDGKVISTPFYEGVIPNGTSQISGSFTEASAKSLATSLKYGALPITFDQSKTTNQVIGPSLAGDQLRAGLTAGIAGLVLVMIYCLLYYRGLGAVVVASLLVAGATTYALVLLLAKSGLHAHPARHRRPHRRGRHHRRLLHRVLRTHP